MSRSPAEKRAVPQPGEGWLHRLINLAVTLLLWAYFTIGFVLLFAPFYLLAAIVAGDRTKAFQRLNHLFYRGFFLLCRLVMPRQNWVVDPALRRLRGSVVVCNHLSYIDPLLLISLFPRHSTIVKNRLFHIPIFGWMLGLSGYLPASSKGRLAERMIVNMERMPDFLADGGNLFIFPEGTRSRTGQVGALNPGAFKIARLCRAPLAVASIENSDLLFRPGRFVFNTCRPNTISLRLRERLAPDYGGSRFSIEALREQVLSLMSGSASGDVAHGNGN